MQKKIVVFDVAAVRLTLALLILLPPLYGISQPKSNNTVIIGVLVYDGMEIQDFAGPSDVFVKAHLFASKEMEVVTIGFSSDSISSEAGLVKIRPHYSVNNAPPLDVFIIPGAVPNVIMKIITDSSSIGAVRTMIKRSTNTLSVCTGAYLVAQTGCLNGLQATTHYRAAKHFQQTYPAVRFVRDVRFVDAGRIVTASGVTSGIDGALHLLETLTNQVVATEVSNIMQFKKKTNEKWPAK